MATGETLAIFTALHGEPPASNYATPDLRNSHPVLDFDASTAEVACFSGVLPRNYAGGGLTVYLHWMGSTATSGAVVWGTAIERMNTDLDSDSFAAQQTATTTCDGTSGIIATSAIAHTSGSQMDSLAAGEPFRLQVQRVAANGSDTMAGDAELVAIEIKET